MDGVSFFGDFWLLFVMLFVIEGLAGAWVFFFYVSFGPDFVQDSVGGIFFVFVYVMGGFFFVENDKIPAFEKFLKGDIVAVKLFVPFEFGDTGEWFEVFLIITVELLCWEFIDPVFEFWVVEAWLFGLLLFLALFDSQKT